MTTPSSGCTRARSGRRCRSGRRATRRCSIGTPPRSRSWWRPRGTLRTPERPPDAGTLAASPGRVGSREQGRRPRPMERPVMLRRHPSHAILTGDSADVYFARADEILAKEGMDPVVTMEVFARQPGVLCGIDEAKVLLAHVLGDAPEGETIVEALSDGDPF